MYDTESEEEDDTHNATLSLISRIRRHFSMPPSCFCADVIGNDVNRRELLHPTSGGEMHDGYGSVQKNFFKKKLKVKCGPVLLISVGWTLLYVCSSFWVTHENDMNESSAHQAEICFLIVKCIFWCFSITALLQGFDVSRHFKSIQNGFSPAIIVQLLSSFAIFVGAFFSIQAAIGMLEGSHNIHNTTFHNSHGLPCLDEKSTGSISSGVLIITDKSLSWLQVFMQTAFLIHIPSFDATHLKTERSALYTVFKSVLFYQIQFNFCLWFIESFVFVDNPVIDCYAMKYLTHNSWVIIAHLFYPVATFYRFQSFISFIICYLQLK